MILKHGDWVELIKTIPDQSIDVIVTDPPYGTLKHRIETDVDIPLFFKECKRILKPNGFLVYFGMQPTLTTWNAEAFKLFTYKNEVIWYKKNHSSPLLDMMRLYENITIVLNGKSRKYNPVRIPYMDTLFSFAEFIEKSSVDKIGSELKSVLKNKDKLEQVINSFNGVPVYVDEGRGNEYATISSRIKKEKIYISNAKKIIRGMKARNVVGFTPHNKQRFNIESHNIKHPTVKPIQLIEYLISLVSNEGDVILDPFMGSGTTGIACRNLNRSFIGFEIFEDYYDIAVQRITQQKQNTDEQKQLSFNDIY